MKVHSFFFLLALACAMIGCDSGEETPSGRYETGLFVVNEGPFGGTGTVTWHDPLTGETEQDIFAKANAGAVLGQFAQSLTVHNGFAYIVVNGTNKVYVVNPATFEFIDSIGDLILPRFILPLDDRYLLVSQWGDGGLDGSVAKVDLLSRKVVSTIRTGNGPEKMLRFDNNTVYVANSGGFGTDSTLTVINLQTEGTSSVVLGGKNPGSLVKVRQNNADVVYALCKGSFLDAAPTGWLGTGKTGIPVSPYIDDLAATADNTLYYADGGNILRIKAPYTTPEVFIAAQFAYGFTATVDGSRFYCADAGNFSTAGTVVIYDQNGQKLSSFSSGIIPGEVVVK